MRVFYELFGVRLSVVVLAALGLVSCGGVPKSHVACSANGFRNDTLGVLTDADLTTAWQHAQKTIADGHWVINAVQHPRCGDPGQVCSYMPPTPAALNEMPRCNSVKGQHGLIDGFAYGEEAGGNVVIDIDENALNRASYEFENVIGCERLGFPCGDR